MHKDELLAELKGQLASGALSAEEVLRILQEPSVVQDDTDATLSSKFSVVLYYIGGGIVFLGLIFLIAQEWNTFGTFARIFVTLGSGIAAFVVGILFTHHGKLGAAGPAFFLISALLLPLGLFVTYDEMGIRVPELSVQAQIAGLLTAVYLSAYFAFRKNVLLVFAVLFATWLFFALTDYIASGAPVFDEFRFVAYRYLMIGLAYMLLGYAFAGTGRKVLTGWLYGFGVVAFLSAGLALGEWKPNQNVFWELIYPGLVFGVIFLSIHLQSRTFLVFGSIFLGAYLTKITAEYFSDSLGWPFALVLVGFLLMGVAYLAVRIRREYIIGQ